MAGSRVQEGRSTARVVKAAAVGAAVASLGVFGLLARATHPGGAKRSSSQPPLTAPRSFVQALNSGLAPGAVGPAGGSAQTVSGGS